MACDSSYKLDQWVEHCMKVALRSYGEKMETAWQRNEGRLRNTEIKEKYCFHKKLLKNSNKNRTL